MDIAIPGLDRASPVSERSGVGGAGYDIYAISRLGGGRRVRRTSSVALKARHDI